MKISKRIFKILIFILIFNLMSTVAYASGVISFIGFTGTKRLLNDLTTAAMVLLPIIVVILVIYFNVRKAGAEQDEQRMWTKRIKVALGCLIGGEVAAGLVNMIAFYFGGQ